MGYKKIINNFLEKHQTYSIEKGQCPWCLDKSYPADKDGNSLDGIDREEHEWLLDHYKGCDYILLKNEIAKQNKNNFYKEFSDWFNNSNLQKKFHCYQYSMKDIAYETALWVKRNE